MAKNSAIGIKSRDERTAAVFLTPFLLGVFIFSVIPIIYSVYLSFVDFNAVNKFGNTDFIGLKNYIDVFSDNAAMSSFGRSLIYSIIYTPLVTIFGLILAVLINKNLYLRGLSRTMMLVPYVANIMGIAIVWSIILDPFDGPVNTILRSIGIANPPLWLGDTKLALICVAVIAVWQNVPFQTIVYLAALQEVPGELYEAADVEGAGWFSKFRSITFPMISPTTFFLVVTAFIGSTQNFNYIATFTRGGPGDSSTVYAYYMYKLAFEYGKYSTGIAMALIVFVFLLIVTIFQWKGQKKWVHY